MGVQIVRGVWDHEEISKMLRRAWSSHYRFGDRGVAEEVERLWSLTPFFPSFDCSKVPYPNGDAYLVAAAPDLFGSLVSLLSKREVLALLSDDELAVLRDVLCCAEGNFNSEE